MTADGPRGRRSLDVVFGLLLASGVTAGAYCLLAVGDLIHPHLFAAAATYLAVRWFCWRRRVVPVQVEA